MGVYVTAGDTTGDGHAEVTVSSSTRSLMKIYQFSSGTFSQLGGDISPFGAIPFVSANGDGQTRSWNRFGGKRDRGLWLGSRCWTPAPVQSICSCSTGRAT